MSETRQFEFEEDFLQVLDSMAAGWGVEVQDLIRAWCIKRIAEINAEIEVHGTANPMVELSTYDGKKPPAKELFRYLYGMEVERLEKKKAKELKRQRDAGAPLHLRPEDEKLVKKYY